MSDLLSIRKVKMYVYTCKACGWSAYRPERIEGAVCSQCGSEDAPEIVPADFELSLSKWTEESIAKAKVFGERLVEGEDPEKLDRELYPAEDLAGLSPEISRVLRGISHSMFGEYKYIGDKVAIEDGLDGGTKVKY